MADAHYAPMMGDIEKIQEDTMFPHLLTTHAREHHRELIAEADRRRLLDAARRHRRERKAARRTVKAPNASGTAGTLAGCGEHAPTPAR